MKSPVKIYLRVRLPDNSYPPHAIHEEALLCVACFYGWCGWLDSRRSGFWCDAQGNRLQFVNLPLEVDHRKGRIVPGWFPDTPSSEWVAQILLHFLLCTGAREQDAQYVCWSDVDLERKTYTVTEHLDLGYRPKDKEEGTLPIPDLLVNVLRNRRERYPRTRLIFPGQRGGANGHALRKQLGISKPLSPHVLRHSFAIWVVMGQKLDKSASRELRQRQRE